MSEFKIKISRPGKFGEKTAATIEMPATWAEFQEALERARIRNSYRDIYSIEPLEAKREYLMPYIKPHVNPFQLNLLAQKLSVFDEHENIRFEDMVKRENNHLMSQQTPLPRLINHAFNEEIYINNKADNIAFFNRSGAPLVLEISKGFFNDPEYDNDLTAELNLPEVYGREIYKALDAVEAASLKEISYTCTDCLIPAAKEWINDADDIGAVIDYANVLDRIERRMHPVQYKALLEASVCDNLETATRLAGEADEYILDPEPEIQDEIDYNELENFAVTSYGNLRRRDGGPIPSAGQDSSGQSMNM